MSDSIELHLRELMAEEPFVRALARELVAQDADDLVQQAYLRAIEKKPAVASPRPWLARVVRNLAHNLRRSDRRRTQREHAVSRNSLVDPEELRVREEQRMTVIRAVDRLPEPLRTTVMLRFFEGLSPRAIAKHFDVPVSTVWNRQREALRRLRRQLDADNGHRGAWLPGLIDLLRPPRAMPPVLPTTSLLTTGAFVMVSKMQATALCATGVVAAALIWSTFRDPAPDDLTRTPQSPIADLTADDKPQAPRAERLPRTRKKTQPITPDELSGSLRVRVSHRDGSAAEGILLSVLYPGASRHERGPTPGKTDATGSLRFSQLPPGKVYLSVARHTLLDHTTTIVAGRESELTVKLAPSIDIRGIVVDANDTPVARARIELKHVGAINDAIPLAETDADGRFTIRGVQRYCRIGARARGHAPSLFHSINTVDGSTVELRLRLPGPGGALRGRVVDHTGRAIAGARVAVGKTGDKTVTLPSGRFARQASPFVATTDDEGGFEAFGLPPGEQAVHVRKSGYGPHEETCTIRSQSTSAIVVRLEPGVVVEGKVIDDTAQPLGGVLVSLAGQSSGTESAKDGTFRLTNLPAGKLQLVAKGGDRGMATTTLESRAGETLQWNPRLATGFVLRGRVLDDNNKPVAKAIVIMTAAADKTKGLGSWSAMQETDSDGEFEGANCPQDRKLRIDVMKRGFDTRFLLHVDPKASPLRIRLAKAAKRTVRVTGVIVGPNGEPVTGATIYSQGESESGGGMTRSKEDGSFALGPIAAGSHGLLVRAVGFAEHRIAARKLADGETWKIGTLRVTRGGRVRVAVRGDALPASAKLRVHARNGKLMAGVDRVEGTLRSKPLAPGEYRLALSGNGIASSWQAFTIQDGVETELTVEWQAGQRVKLAFALPPSDKSLRVVSFDITDGSGVVAKRRRVGQGTEPVEFETWLRPGRYTVTARTREEHTGRQTFDVPAKQPVRIVLR